MMSDDGTDEMIVAAVEDLCSPDMCKTGAISARMRVFETACHKVAFEAYKMPSVGLDEALGPVFGALAAVWETECGEDEVTIITFPSNGSSLATPVHPQCPLTWRDFLAGGEEIGCCLTTSCIPAIGVTFILDQETRLCVRAKIELAADPYPRAPGQPVLPSAERFAALKRGLYVRECAVFGRSLYMEADEGGTLTVPLGDFSFADCTFGRGPSRTWRPTIQVRRGALPGIPGAQAAATELILYAIALRRGFLDVRFQEPHIGVHNRPPAQQWRSGLWELLRQAWPVLAAFARV